MTENLLQKLEEKMMQLLTDLEDARKEITRLNVEREAAVALDEQRSEKINSLLSLLDSINPAVENNVMMNVTGMKPMLVQA